MNRSGKSRFVIAAAFVAVLTADGGALFAAAGAGPSPQAAIAVRQAGYKKMGGAMKALNEQLKSDAPARDVMMASARIVAATARDQPKLFPAGSAPAPGIKTDALPNIWTDRATFDASANKLIAESTKLLALVEGGNVAAIRVQAKATGAACASCHRQFRADN